MSKKYKSVSIRCDHEAKGVDEKVVVPDYHPLSKREIRNLLYHAKQTSSNRLRASIQVRLLQGIKGYVCPRIITGEIIQKENEISWLYLDNMHVEPINIIVNKMFNIMTA